MMLASSTKHNKGDDPAKPKKKKKPKNGRETI
jgi:hypothetical protein